MVTRKATIVERPPLIFHLMKTCSVCPRIPHGRGYCSRHFWQMKKYGKILQRTRRDPNEIIDCRTHYEIVLYNKFYQESGRAKIDKKDLLIVQKYKWSI